MNRRNFLGVIGAGSGTLLSTTVAGTVGSSGMSPGTTGIPSAKYDPKTLGSTEASSSTLKGKIALEEHFLLPETDEPDSNLGSSLFTPELQRQLKDVGSGRIGEMDSGGVELAILSSPGPGIQAIPNKSQAIAVARKTNDYLAEQIAKYPKRLKGFAALPLQDPQVAAQELRRCVKELGFCGALVAGFSQIEEADSAFYYDLPQYRAFWATVEQFDVPFYLHPACHYLHASNLMPDTRGSLAALGDSRPTLRFTRSV